jgi:16S rRNA (uracil1498-N3)-methyltransferase
VTAGQEAPKHRFWVAAAQVDGDQVTFSADQAQQLASVLRMRAGGRVRVFDGETVLDQVVELTHVSRQGAEGRCIGSVQQAHEPRTRLIAYPALLQRDKLESVLQKLVEVGVAAVAPVLTARSLVRELPDERKTRRWRAILREAAEQSGRGLVPELRPALDLRSALGQARREGNVLLAALPPRGMDLRQALLGLDPDRPVSAFVGPEGGFTTDELDLAQSLAARIVSLGPRILRTETASPILAALLLHELEPRPPLPGTIHRE